MNTILITLSELDAITVLHNKETIISAFPRNKGLSNLIDQATKLLDEGFNDKDIEIKLEIEDTFNPSYMNDETGIFGYIHDELSSVK